QVVRRAQAARRGGHGWTEPGSDGAAGRARAADAASRARAGRAQVHSARHARAFARIIEPAGGRLSRRAPAVPLAALPGGALRSVLLARVGRRRAIRGRGRVSAGGVTRSTHTGRSNRVCTSNMAVAKPWPSARISRISETGVGRAVATSPTTLEKSKLSSA